MLTSEKQDKLICPCCGEQTLEHKEPSQEIQAHYLSCILSGTPFWKLYYLYNNSLLIAVSCQVPARAAKIVSAIRHIDSVAKPSNDMRINLLYILNRMALIKYRKITLPSKTEKRYEIWQAVDKVVDDMLKFNVPLGMLITDDYGNAVATKFILKLTDTDIFSAVPRELIDIVLSQHVLLYNRLIKCGEDENFWTGINLG